MPCDEPLLVIETQPVMEGTAEVLHGVERADPYELLFECANEPFRHAVTFRSAHKRWTRRDPEKPEFRLEIVAYILTAMIMPHLQACRDAS